jgi:serine protease Do
MRRSILSLICLSAAAIPAYAQQSRTPAPRVRTLTTERMTGGDRAVLGLSMSSTGKRDTLGVLVQSVTPGGPAEKAGIEEGNRIAAISGVSLKVPREDAGDDEMTGAMQSRLQREMRKVKAGDEVSLEIWAGGRAKTVKVKTVASDDLTPARATRISAEERAMIGISLGSTGNKRDTAGVFVSGVSDGGPAEKAGIIEGDRLSAINGVDLRVAKEDAGDGWVANARVQRLQREIAKLKPGQSADLTVISGGRTRSVKVTTIKASELPRENGYLFRFGDGEGFVMPPMPPMAPMTPSAPRVRIYRNGDRMPNSEAMDSEVRRNLEIEFPRAMERARTAIEHMKIRVGRTII